MLKKQKKRIERLVSQHFDKQYESFEEFKKDLNKKIEQALKDVEEGRYQTLDEFCAEMEEEYDIK